MGSVSLCYAACLKLGAFFALNETLKHFNECQKDKLDIHFNLSFWC